jgi:hypothetical protein
VKEDPFYFEIKDVLTQFIAAFDDVVIARFNRAREKQDHIQVRYVYAPKQRVLYDLINKAKGITLPVIAINIASIRRDEKRVFNKLSGSYYSQTKSTILTGGISRQDFIKQPVPIDITVNMSILTKFQTDMDQILSNFIPYTNPYIVISWKVPSSFTVVEQEIRSEVLWDGGMNMTYPTDVTASQHYRVSADTSFTIKGWLFQKYSTPVNTIFTVDSNFTSLSSIEDMPNITTAIRLSAFNAIFDD